MGRDKVHLYTMSLNEMTMLDYFFRHYDDLVDRYFVYDDGSTDGTLDALLAHPKVECRRFQRVVADSFLRSTQVFHNNVWKESRGKADWVILTAIDEHLSHPGMAVYLRQCEQAGITAIPALGYEMVGRKLPRGNARLSSVITTGVPDRQMSKLSIFCPDAIESTGYFPGRHNAFPRGNVVYPPMDEVMLLHYKYVDPSYTVDRQHALQRALSSRDRNWNVSYSHPSQKILDKFASLERRAVDVSNAHYLPSRDHPGARWWRMSRVRHRLKILELLMRGRLVDWAGRHKLGRYVLHHLRVAQKAMTGGGGKT